MYLVVKHVPTGSLGLQQFSAAIYGWDRQVTCDRHLSINSASDCKRHTSEGKLTDTNTLIQLVIIHIFSCISNPICKTNRPSHTCITCIYMYGAFIEETPKSQRDQGYFRLYWLCS